MSIGIYKIENRINGKIYIGQSWNIENRIKSHKAREHNAHLRASYAKYGIENFTFGTIRRISESGLTQILLDASEREKARIGAYKGWETRRRHQEEALKLAKSRIA